ncbi:MAG: DUF1854 domain-containing protein [Fimbriimonas sp.]|nr:DUF1854 domain-containing protein [Fimbriimonas sp.]
MSRLTYLDPANIELRRREGSLFLDVEINGEWVENVRLVRAFPLSHTAAFISIRDEENKEFGIIESLAALDNDSQKLAHEELDRRYFTPAITRIKALKNDASMWWFDVETTRGPSDFYVRNWRDNAHELTPGRWQITSVDGGRYEILNLDELDERSQVLIEQLL